MFKSLRNSIAKFISADHTPAVMSIPNGRSLTHSNAPDHIITQHTRATREVLTGNFHVSDVHELSSERLQHAITGLGAWSALARAFSEYERVTGKRQLSDAKLCVLMDEFHAWNAASATPMSPESTEEIAARLAPVAPSKGSLETDEIIAQVRGVSVLELRKQRVEQAQKKTNARIQMIQAFNDTLWGCTSTDTDYALSAAKVLDKAVQTLEWVASWESNNAAEQAAELLLIQSDIKVIKVLAKSERHNNEDYIDGVMAADTLNKNIDSKDHHRRAGENGEGSSEYEQEPMDKVDNEEVRPTRTRIRRQA